MTTKASILKAVRAKCLDCCYDQLSEIAKCTAYTCELHPFRMGRDPDPSRTRGYAKQRVYADDSGSDGLPEPSD